MQAALPTVETAGAGMLAAYALHATRRIIALRSQLPLINAEAPTAWVHVAYEGEWEGHSEGAFEFTRKVFDQIITNFERQQNAVKLDFDHETVFSDGPTPARGWVHQLELRKRRKAPYGVSLWALVEFGKEATTINRDGGYRFCSGVFEFDAVDRVTGKECGCEMTSLALTDSPFLDGQSPIKLSRRAAPGGNMADAVALNVVKKASLIEALDQFPEDDLTPEQIEAAARFAAEKDGTAEKPEEALADEPALAGHEDDEEDEVATSDEPAPDAAALAEDVALQDPDADAALAALAPLMEKTGLDLAALTAAVIENLDAVAAALSGALQEPAADAPLGAQPPGMPGGGGDPAGAAALSLRTTQEALGSVTKQRDSLLGKLEAIESKEADEAVETYVQGGYVLDDAKADMVKLYRTNRGGFDKIVACMKPTVETGERTPPPVEQDALPEVTEDDLKDENIKALKRSLEATRTLSKAQIDKAIRGKIAARKQTRV